MVHSEGWGAQPATWSPNLNVHFPTCTYTVTTDESTMIMAMMMMSVMRVRELQ